MSKRPMLDDLELQQVQKVESDEDQVFGQHDVPALEGDFLQGLGRRATAIRLRGVLTDDTAAEGLKKLREKFRAAAPVPFTDDIATATQVGKVLIEEMGVRELAGKPQRFAYAIALREFVPPPPPKTEPPPPPPPPPPDVTTATLVVEVIVQGQPGFDFSTVTVTVDGTQDDRTVLSRTLTKRKDNVWTDDTMPPGSYSVKAVAASAPPMSGTADAKLRPGATTKVTIRLKPGVIVATAFVVHFRFDKAFVEPCMRQVLAEAHAFAAAHRDQKMLVVGHTDKVGPGPYNQSLSERRARAVFAFLTFGRDRKGAVAEWNAIRQKQKGLPTLGDNWGTRQYQHILQDLGFYPGNVNGKENALTQDAVRAFRCQHGLPPGSTVDDATWTKLIEAYLGQDNFQVPEAQLLPNGAEKLKWLGCGEEQPLPLPKPPKETAHRPYRRVEILFVNADALPGNCKVPQPDTFDLPPPGGAVNTVWALGPGDKDKHACFATRDCDQAKPPTWCIELADKTTVTVTGSVVKEDGTAVANKKFVLLTADGEFKASELTSGEPKAAVTDAKGTFTFAGVRAGVFGVELLDDVVVRLKEEQGRDAKGNAVCKRVTDKDSTLDIVVLKAPLLREIRLATVAHLMTALRADNRQPRTCADATAPGGRTPQATALVKQDDAVVRALFDQANAIWKQARIRFDPVDVVREFYAHPIITECGVDDDELKFLLKNCAYPDVANVLFFGIFASPGEAGGGVSIEAAAVDGLPGGCGVGDKALIGALPGATPVPTDLTPPQRIEVLAHELGHFLDLSHTSTADRLMFESTSDGSNVKLIATEIDHARKSKAARQECLPLSLKVTGATRVGTPRSAEFMVVAPGAQAVVVDAQISDELLAVGTLTMTGGDPGANDRQRTVATAASGPPVTVTATYKPTGAADVFTRHVVVRVVAFTLQVQGAVQVGGGTTFVARRGPGTVTIVANIDPPSLCVPLNLVIWTKGTEAPDPLRRTVSAANVSSTTVTATLAGVTRSVTVNVIQPQIDFAPSTTAGAAALTFVNIGLWDNAFRADGTVFVDLNEANHFAGADTRKFHIRVNDAVAAGTGSIKVEWRTLDQAGANLDAPADQTITLFETPAGSGTFVSRGLILVTDADDQRQPTPAAFNAADHRVRRGSMRGTVESEYKPAGATPVKANLPTFQRAPESRKRLPLQIFVLRVAPGGAGIILTDPASDIWNVDLRQIREVYERLGIEPVTVVAPGTPANSIVRNGADSLVLIDRPAGVADPAHVTLDDETKIAQAFPGIADTIRVFYTGGLTGNRGESYPDVDFSSKPTQASAFLNRVAPTFNAAHEIAHILTDKPVSKNGAHYVQPAAPAGNRLFVNQNLLRNGTSGVEGVSETKRLWDAADGDGVNQFTAIRGSHYLRSL